MAVRLFHWSTVFDCVMHETDAASTTIAPYTHEPAQFGPLLSENRGGTEFCHHYDNFGSATILTVDPWTVRHTFQYDTWAHTVSRADCRCY